MPSQTDLTTSPLPGAVSTARPSQAVTTTQSKRLLFIDNFRILLICGVLVVHLNVTYGWLGSWMYRARSLHWSFPVDPGRHRHGLWHGALFLTRWLLYAGLL